MNAAQLVTIRASSLASAPATVAWVDDVIIIEGALYPLCAFQESFCLEVHSFTDETPKEFIADSATSLVIRNRGSMFVASRLRNISDAVRNFFLP